MKAKIAIVVILGIGLLSFTLVSNHSPKIYPTIGDKNQSVKNDKGFAMEDRDQWK